MLCCFVAQAVGMVVDQLVDELDTDKDGLISWEEFSEWNRRRDRHDPPLAPSGRAAPLSIFNYKGGSPSFVV